ncbi:MAG: ABC transporter permease, partial [Actinomycetota bacterium]
MATIDPGLLGAPPVAAAEAEVSADVVGRTPWQLFWMRLRQDRYAVVGAGFIVLLILLALAAPLISEHVVHHGPYELHQREATTEFGLPKIGPSKAYWFGADKLGRDVFVRTLYGTRTSLLVALIATTISVAIGVTLGMLAGFRRGWVDTVISRAIDLVLAMPLLVFAIGIA